MTRLGKRYINRAALIAASTRVAPVVAVSQSKPDEPIYAIDVDDVSIEPVGVYNTETEQVEIALDEQHQHAERQVTHWLAEYQRLCEAVKKPAGDCEKRDDREAMRAVIEAQREIVSAAIEWMGTWELCGRGSPQGRALKAAVDSNRERLGLAMSAWENSQTWAPWELTPEERAAVAALSNTLHGKPRLTLVDDSAALASAIAKLTDANGEGK